MEHPEEKAETKSTMSTRWVMPEPRCSYCGCEAIIKTTEPLSAPALILAVLGNLMFLVGALMGPVFVPALTVIITVDAALLGYFAYLIHR